MTDQSTIFGNAGGESQTPAQDSASQTAPQQSAPQQQQQMPDAASEWIGEGKKYATVEKALESVGHSQTHIQKLEQEKAEMQAKLAALEAAKGEADEQLGKLGAVDELLAKLNSQQEAAANQPDANGVSEDAVKALVEATLKQRDAESTFAGNQKKVANALTEKLGDQTKAAEAYKARAEELGMTVAQVDQLAGSNPAAALALFGEVAKPKADPAPTQSSVNTSGFQKGEEVPRTFSKANKTSDLLSQWQQSGKAARDALGIKD